MNNQILFVPVEENEKIFLYTITSWASSLPPIFANKWYVNGISPKRLQKEIGTYFEKSFPPEIYPGITIYNNSKKDMLKDFTDSTFSIYLGLFIEIFKFIRHRTFKPTWNTITITGDIAIHEGIVEPVGVTHINEKYTGVKSYAEEHEKENHLFLYVSDERPVESGWNGNFEVKAFTPQDSIGAIIAELFEPAFDPKQNEFFDPLRDTLELWDYVSTPVFEEMKRTALSKKWTGFLIHGEGESGKSAMAFELSKYLAEAERIYAPIWVRIEENEKLRELFATHKKSRSVRLGQKTDPLENPVTAHIAGLIAETLHCAWTPENGLSTLANELKRDENCPYLLIIDNLEVNEVDEVWKSVQTIVNGCSPRLPVVLTSRIKGNIAGLTEIRPSALTADDIEKLVENVAGTHGQDYAQELINRKGKQEYDEFIDRLHKNFASFPGIITVIIPQLDRGLPALLQTLDNLNLLDKDANEKAEAIYTTLFSHLDSFTQVVLFLFIRLTLPWIDASKFNNLTQAIWQIMSGFCVSGMMQFDGISCTPAEIEEKTHQALNELARIHLLNRDTIGAAERSGKNEYYIKTLPMKIFISNESIINAIIPVPSKMRIFMRTFYDSLNGEFLLKALIGPEELIRICIYYQQSGGRLKFLLDKYYGKSLLRDDSLFIDYSFLIWAAKHSTTDEHISILYKHGYKKVDERYILHYAAFCNPNEEVIQQLLVYAKVSRKDREGRTPLHYAAWGNSNPNIINLLYNEEPRTMYIRTEDGDLPIHYAAQNTNPDVFKRLVELDRRLLDYANSNGLLPLFEFIMHCNDPNIVSWLKEKQIDLNTTKPSNGMTLLHFAALNTDETILRKLIEADVKTNVTDKNGLTVLHNIAANSELGNMNENIIPILLECGLNIHAIDSNGNTPLHIAAIHNKDICSILVLLIHGAKTDINVKNKEGLTPLNCAVLYNEDPNVIYALIENDEDIFIPDDKGVCLIHSASLNKEPAVIKVFIEAYKEKGVTLDVTDNDGETPLHYAADNENPEIPIALIKAGAALDAKDNTGKPAIAYLKKRKDWSVIKKAIK